MKRRETRVSHNPEWAGSEPHSEAAVETAAFDATASDTGHAEVDAALARLGELEALPIAEHVAVFEDVHGRLQEALAELDGS